MIRFRIWVETKAWRIVRHWLTSSSKLDQTFRRLWNISPTVKRLFRWSKTYHLVELLSKSFNAFNPKPKTTLSVTTSLQLSDTISMSCSGDVNTAGVG